ncbi:MAG: class I SAM-dependent methyltransferase [Bacteroidota bacterium]
MNWKEFWNKAAIENSAPMAQVGRIKSGEIVDQETVQHILSHILQQLSLTPTDTLLDVCCGNGFLTHHLAKHCKQVTGIDLSVQQIEIAAENYHRSNIEYICGDVCDIVKYVNQSFDKINLYFSWQYFDTFSKGEEAFIQLWKLLKPGGTMFIGDVPLKEKLNVFYPTPARQATYHLNLIRGKSDMGKFWAVQEMEQLGKAVGAEFSYTSQPDTLPYAHYRGDFLFKKPI